MLATIIFLCTAANRPRFLSPTPVLNAHCDQVHMIPAGEDLPDSDRGGWTCNSQQGEDFTDCYNAGKHYVVGPAGKESHLPALPTQTLNRR